MNNTLPSQFESFAEARQQGFLAVKNLKNEGKIVDQQSMPV